MMSTELQRMMSDVDEIENRNAAAKALNALKSPLPTALCL
jgi:hypothetical protein